jgi:uncharacterized protein
VDLKGKGGIIHAAFIALVFIAAIWYYASTRTFTASYASFIVIGAILAVVDTGMGMGYGTVGSPLLLLLGFKSVLVVPSVLISQGLSSISASRMHHKYKNVDILNLKGRDARIAFLLVTLGIIGTLIGVALGISLPKLYVNVYIGLLVIVMGIILVSKARMKFSWRRIEILSLVSGFNKSLTAGGYGPVVTPGQVISGNEPRAAIGITVFAVVPLAILSFLLYLAAGTIPSLAMPIYLSTGAVVGSVFGPRLTSRVKADKHMRLFGFVVIALGLLTIITTIW